MLTRPRRTEHCDNLSGPSIADVARVREMYQNGRLDDYIESFNTDDSDEGVFKWYDYAWAESEHEVRLFYRLGSNSGWIRFDSYRHDDLVGLHKNLGRYNWDISRLGDRQVVQYQVTVPLTVHTDANQGVSLPEESYYMVCVRAFFNQGGSAISTEGAFGPLTCSDELPVSNSAHNLSLLDAPSITSVSTSKSNENVKATYTKAEGTEHLAFELYRSAGTSKSGSYSGVARKIDSSSPVTFSGSYIRERRYYYVKAQACTDSSLTECGDMSPRSTIVWMGSFDDDPSPRPTPQPPTPTPQPPTPTPQPPTPKPTPYDPCRENPHSHPWCEGAW